MIMNLKEKEQGIEYMEECEEDVVEEKVKKQIDKLKEFKIDEKEEVRRRVREERKKGF